MIHARDAVELDVVTKMLVRDIYAHSAARRRRRASSTVASTVVCGELVCLPIFCLKKAITTLMKS